MSSSVFALLIRMRPLASSGTVRLQRLLQQGERLFEAALVAPQGSFQIERPRGVQQARIGGCPGLQQAIGAQETILGAGQIALDPPGVGHEGPDPSQEARAPGLASRSQLGGAQPEAGQLHRLVRPVGRCPHALLAEPLRQGPGPVPAAPSRRPAAGGAAGEPPGSPTGRGLAAVLGRPAPAEVRRELFPGGLQRAPPAPTAAR